MVESWLSRKILLASKISSAYHQQSSTFLPQKFVIKKYHQNLRWVICLDHFPQKFETVRMVYQNESHFDTIFLTHLVNKVSVGSRCPASATPTGKHIPFWSTFSRGRQRGGGGEGEQEE